MKYILFLLLFLSFNLSAQKSFEYEQINDSTFYAVQYDTIGSDVIISKTLKTAKVLQDEIDRQIADFDREILHRQGRIERLQAEIKSFRQKKKDIEPPKLKAAKKPKK